MDETPTTFWTGPNLPGSFQKKTPSPPPPKYVSEASVKCFGIASNVNQGGSSRHLVVGCPYCMEVWRCKHAKELSQIEWSSKISFACRKSSGFPPGNLSLEVVSAAPTTLQLMRCGKLWGLQFNSLEKNKPWIYEADKATLARKPQRCPLISIFEPIRSYVVFTVD